MESNWTVDRITKKNINKSKKYNKNNVLKVPTKEVQSKIMWN